MRLPVRIMADNLKTTVTKSGFVSLSLGIVLSKVNLSQIGART